MTDFLDRLELQLVGAVERHAPAASGGAVARGRKAARLWPGFGRRPLVVLAALILLGGSATAAVVSLTASRPLSGTLSHGPAPGAAIGRSRYEIMVFPYMAVGWSGWCTTADFHGAHGRADSFYGCGPDEASGDPTVGGELFGSYEYGVVRDVVAAVRFSYGRTVVPISDPRLPPGMRAFFTIHPPLGQSDRPPWTETLLDSHGHVIPVPMVTAANAVEHLPLRAIDPRHPGNAPCAVRARTVRGVKPIAETVSTPVPWPRHHSGAFEACSNATFRLGSSTLAVALLINASDPQRPAPPLPELRVDPRRRGLLTGTGLGSIGFPEGSGVADFSAHARPFHLLAGQQVQVGTPADVQALANHDVSARRAGRAWLIAEGGTATQRTALLAALIANP